MDSDKKSSQSEDPSEEEVAGIVGGEEAVEVEEEGEADKVDEEGVPGGVKEDVEEAWEWPSASSPEERKSSAESSTDQSGRGRPFLSRAREEELRRLREEEKEEELAVDEPESVRCRLMDRSGFDTGRMGRPRRASVHCCSKKVVKTGKYSLLRRSRFLVMARSWRARSSSLRSWPIF